MKKKIIIMILLSLLLTSLLISCTSEEKQQENNSEESSIFEKTDIENVKITSDNCDVKSGSGDNFETVGNLKKDQIVNVTKELDDWYLVQLDNNEVGAVKKSDAEPVVVDESENNNTDKQNENNKTDKQNEDNKTVKNEDSAKETNKTLSNSENEMVSLVNKEREKNNLPKLKVDTEVTKVARVKSQDMVDNNYFSNYSPNYGSPFEMMKSFGIKYVHAGENLAGNQSVESAHTALMNSSGHRKNILSPDFTHIGIGIKDSDKYGYVFTQMFISKPK